MGRSSRDDIVLSYNDVVLRRSDLDILNGPCFLNDRILEFYFTYLSTRHVSDEILLVSPSISFWFQNCSDVESLKAFAEPLNLPDKKLVLFPVNDNEDTTQAEAGSHWSLLAFCRTANVFVHHDSLGGMNSHHARRLFSAVAGLMGGPNSARYLEDECSPLQNNSYDCGLFVTATARVICMWYINNSVPEDGEDLWFSSLKKEVTPSAVSDMRAEILDLIRELQDKK